MTLPLGGAHGWQLKRYAIFADGRSFDPNIADAAEREAVRRLPNAGSLTHEDGNHGVGIQIVHFAEVAVVSPVFYWQWGTVLANIDQMRAQWESPTDFQNGVQEVVGCIWEMDITNFEIDAWKNIMLNGVGAPETRLEKYLSQALPRS